MHVRVLLIMETLKNENKKKAKTVALVVQLCSSWLFPGKVTRIFQGRNSNGTVKLGKKGFLFTSAFSAGYIRATNMCKLVFTLQKKRQKAKGRE